MRIVGKGKGKRGGYRVITYVAHRNMPVYLLAVYGKGRKVDLTPAERALMRELAKGLLAQYQSRSER